MRWGQYFRIEPLRADQAREILDWKYPPPYDFYDPPGDMRHEDYVREFLNPALNFHGVMDAHGALIGFCSFGVDGQVPGGDYADEALDIGLGMKPELTGRGLGPSFFSSILAYATEMLRPRRYRLTVANFNERAINLYHKFGFTLRSEFEDEQLRVPHIILVREAS